jgi:hypothetical protein
MIRRSSIQRSRIRTAKPPDQTSVQAKSEDVPCDVSGLTRPYVSESRQERRADGIVVADHRGRAFDRADNAQQLPAVEQLPMREMHVGDGDVAEPNNLRNTRRQAARHSRDRQRQGLRRRQRVGAPCREPMNAARQGLPMKIAADEVGERLHLLGRFLHEKEIRPLPLRERSDVLDSGAGQAQQIPADDLQSDFPLRPIRQLRPTIRGSRLMPVKRLTGGAIFLSALSTGSAAAKRALFTEPIERKNGDHGSISQGAGWNALEVVLGAGTPRILGLMALAPMMAC